MAVVHRYIGILTVGVFFFQSTGIFCFQISFPSTFCPRLWETSSGVVAVGVFAAEAHSWGCLPQLGTKRRGEGILRMEDARTSEEEDTNSQDSNIHINHDHLAQNCLIKIIMLALKALVISFCNLHIKIYLKICIWVTSKPNEFNFVCSQLSKPRIHNIKNHKILIISGEILKFN